jgi:aminoglycoside 6'-N-acetyltransferase
VNDPAAPTPAAPTPAAATPAPPTYEFAEPIVTERLTLRLMTAGDLDDVVAYQGREDVCRYLLHGPRSREDLVPRIAEWGAATRMTQDDDYLQLAIQREQRVIGHMYLHLASAENLQGEIGWTLHPDFFGHGYATEASRALLDLAFHTIGFHRMRAELDPRNDASIALCLRLGMRHEATFRQDMWFKGEWADTGVYAILAEEWATAKAAAAAE